MKALEAEMLQTEDKQISLTDPDARSMATSGRGSGIVGYDVPETTLTDSHQSVRQVLTGNTLTVDQRRLG